MISLDVDYMYKFMFYLLFYQFIVLLASVIFNIYKEVEKEIEEETEEEEEIKMVPYEDKYKDKIKTINSLQNDKTFLDKLKFSFVMETTPNGNVLMFWDNNRSSFIYYSDTSIPYRYLEVVARKYVIMNNCREIYFIMEEQLKPLKKEEIVEKKEEKNVFAKLKSYNQSSILDTKNIAPKKKNQNTQLPRIQINQKETDKNEILLKENANRYSYEGKLINFSFLQKPKKNMKEKISFSEFKKYRIQNIINK